MHAESWRWHNNNERHSLLEIYTSHFIWKGCVWEWVGDRSELQHIDPNFYCPQPFFLVLLGCLTGGLGGPICWVLVFSTAPYLQIVWSPTDWISCALSYIIVQRLPSSYGRHNFALIQPVQGLGYILIIPRPDAPVIYTGSFSILTVQLGRRSIYITSECLLSYRGHSLGMCYPFAEVRSVYYTAPPRRQSKFNMGLTV